MATLLSPSHEWGEEPPTPTVPSFPPPRLYDSNGSDLTLPAGASIAAGSEHGDLLVSFTGMGSGTTITNPPALPNHVFVKVGGLVIVVPLPIPVKETRRSPC